MAFECLLGQMGRFLMTILLAGGCVCAYLAANSCEFFSYQSKDPLRLPGLFTNVTAGSVGLFGYFDESNTCTVYEENFMQASTREGGDFNAYFITAQFSAIIGPACAAMAWLLNLVEWMFWSNQCTYVLVVVLLLLGFSVQGLTFMIYGQTEFCFDDRISEECSMEFGAYMAIAATSAFYCASIVWCCMPRSDPFCIAKGNVKNSPSNRNSRDNEDDFYVTGGTGGDINNNYNNNNNTFETGNSYENEDELESQNDYYYSNNTNADGGSTGGGYNNKSWADSENRGPIPQQQQQQQSSSSSSPYQPNYQQSSSLSQDYDDEDVPPPSPADWQQQQSSSSSAAASYGGGAAAAASAPPAVPDPPADFQDHTSSWTAHEISNPTPGYSPGTNSGEEPFANPFLVDEDSAAQRPAYGNLQG